MEQVEFTIFVILVTTVLMIFIVGTIIFIFQFRERKIKYEIEKRLLQENYEFQLLHSKVKTQEETMHFIGEEIHDSVAQKITLATIYTHKIGLNKHSAPLKHELDNILKVLDDALEELRDLSNNLTDTRLQEADLPSLLQKECDRIISTGRCKAILSADIQYSLKPTTKTFLLRIVQEFIQNSLKYSKCTLIEITLGENDENFYLKIKDNGIGFDIEASKHKGNGLQNMRRRMQMLNAKYEFSSTAANGTSLEILIDK